MKNKALLILGVILLVASCSSEAEDNGVMKKKSSWKPEMDQPSELASIMRAMNTEALERKASLEAGELGEASSDLIFNLITAIPTEPHMKGPAFEPHAKSFIKSYEVIGAAKNVADQIDAHNNLVKSCVACHMNFCQGPIPRIEKLYIQ